MIPRESYLAKLRPFIDQPEIVKVITGIRRSGKSVMLRLVQNELLGRGIALENILSLNFEDMQLAELRNAERLHQHVKKTSDRVKGRTYLFLDEIQEVDGWERCINSLRINANVDIYLTGSNARLLAGEYATHLAGRYMEMQIHPFSLREFHAAVAEKQPDITPSAVFQQYLKQGGMPFLFQLESEEARRQYLQDIYASVVIKDIMKRNGFRDVDLLERIILYVMANIGRTFSANSISKFLKSEKRSVSPETVMNYLKGCEDAFLFKKVRRFDIEGKKLLQINEKYYLADHGVREAVYGYNQRDIELILENMVFLELLRQGYQMSIGRMGDREVDFVCDKASERIYVQVCYLLASEDTIEREFGVYDDIPDHFPKFVLSLDEFDMGRKGVRHLNARDFLLYGFPKT